MPEQEVRLQTLDGTWETVGVNRLAGIFPEAVNPTSNTNGSDTVRFRLKRDESAIHPDLSAFTPCEILEDGIVIWSGRVWETPSAEGPDAGITVEGRGWQYHLDDLPYSYPYTRIRMSNFKDMRQNVNAYLSSWTADGVVNNEGSTVVLGWAKGATVAPGNGAGVRYDLGPDYEQLWAHFLVTVKSSMTDTAIGLYVRAHDSEDAVGAAPIGPGSDYEDLFFDSNATWTSTMHFWLIGTVPRRYVSIFPWYAGSGGTFGADQLLQVQQFQVYGKDTYREMIDDSHLRLSDIAMDAVERAAPLFKPSTERTSRFIDELTSNPSVIDVWDFGKYQAEEDNRVIGEVYGWKAELNGTMSPEPTVVAGGVDNALNSEVDVNALDFAGNNFLAVGSLTPLSHARVATVLLFKADALPQYGCLAHVGNPTTNGWGYFIGNGAASSTIYLYRAGVGFTSTGITITAGTWYLMRAQWTYWFGTMDFEIYDANGTVGTHSVAASFGAPSTILYFAGTDGTNQANITIDTGALFNAPLESYATNSNTDYMARLREAALAKQDGNLQRTTFWIPEFPMETAQTPREVINAANSFEDLIWKADHAPSLVLKERPTGAVFEVGSWSGAEFEDASANSGEEIYNMVRCEGTDYLGNAYVVTRGGFSDSDLINFSNPGFETNTTGWSMFVPGSATITRDTGLKRSGTASGRVDVTSAPHTPTALTSSWVGSWESGRIYKVVAYMYRTAKANDVGEIKVVNTNGSTVQEKSKVIPSGAIGRWLKVELEFRFDAIGTIQFEIQNQTDGTTGTIFYLDDLEIYTLDDSLPSRRGFIRAKVLPVSAAVTRPALERIGDVWVEAREATPFKGTLKATIPGGVRRLVGGDNVRPGELLNHTGERILFSHRIDPDTGDHGRLGTINTVSYDGTTGVATVSIDNTRLNFETLLNRYTGIVSAKR